MSIARWQPRIPDVVFQTELGARHAQLEGLMTLVDLPGELVLRALHLRERHRAITANDGLCLALAEADECLLLTGDRQLRRAATAEQLEVHGTLFAVKTLVTGKALRSHEARAAFERLRTHRPPRRLPWPEVEELLESFDRGSS